MKRYRWIVLLLFFLTLVGCSHQVPLRQGLEVSDPPNPKYDKKVLLVMPQDQAERIIRHKPDPLADTYVYAGGPALKNTLQNVLDQLFRETDFAYTLPQGGGDYDLAVVVDFKQWNIVLNIYTGNTVDLDVDYLVLDPSGKTLLHIPTQASSKDRYSGGDLAATFLAGAFYNIGKMKASSGAAWDQATANSIAELLDKMVVLLE